MCVCTSVPEAQQTMTALPEHQEPLHSSQDSRGSTQQQWTPHGSHENLAEEACMYVVKHTKTYIHMYCMHVQMSCMLYTYIHMYCMHVQMSCMLYTYIHMYCMHVQCHVCCIHTYVHMYCMHVQCHVCCMYVYVQDSHKVSHMTTSTHMHTSGLNYNTLKYAYRAKHTNNDYN